MARLVWLARWEIPEGVDVDLLAQIQERGRYGAHRALGEYVVKGFRMKAEAQAYQLIFAYRMDELFLANGCSRPVNERQVRPLSILKKDELRLLAWNRACKMTRRNSPSCADVQREVNRLHTPKPQQSLDERFRAYRQHLENMHMKLKRASEMLEEGDLEEFLLQYDKIPCMRHKNVIAKLITRMGVTLGNHYQNFADFLETPPEEDENEV